MRKVYKFEWPTVGLFVGTYVLWALSVFWVAGGALWLAVPLAAIAIAFHGSLQHEAIHGHPTGWVLVNAGFAWPPLSIVVPYLRFRDTHLDHHRDANLTDPYDDPETHFMAPDDWAKLSTPLRHLLAANNTLAGRLLFGPLVGTFCFFRNDWRQRNQDPRISRGWRWHALAVLPVIGLVAYAPMPIWAYLLSVYVGLSLLRIRTFLEHQAHEQARARSVIIEDRGPLAFLFLNNNLHAVHHAHPQVPWYQLPSLYRAGADRFLRMNGGYRFRSYAEIFRKYIWHRKDPVAHPLRR
ncbi:MAG: fatty acid desaturase [Pseudomonadota bacterium]